LVTKHLRAAPFATPALITSPTGASVDGSVAAGSDPAASPPALRTTRKTSRKAILDHLSGSLRHDTDHELMTPLAAPEARLAPHGGRSGLRVALLDGFRLTGGTDAIPVSGGAERLLAFMAMRHRPAERLLVAGPSGRTRPRVTPTRP
jgi:hypothetical protein